MTRQPRFDIVRTDAGHHARFVAANGRVVWTTEVYTRRRAAVEAIELVCDASVAPNRPSGLNAVLRGWLFVEVRDVDERGAL